FTVAFDAPIASIEALPQEVADATRRVMFVSALASMRVSVSDGLARHGIEAATTADAHSALAQLEAAGSGASYDCLIIDTVPGGIGQLEFARCVRLNRAGANTRVVALTDGAGGDDPLVDAWVHKPVDVDALLRAISSDGDQRPAAASPSGGGGRLLVVEDNRVNQKVAVAVLTKMGYTVEVACDGVEAL